jgi:hypothetical protein
MNHDLGGTVKAQAWLDSQAELCKATQRALSAQREWDRQQQIAAEWGGLKPGESSDSPVWEAVGDAAKDKFKEKTGVPSVIPGLPPPANVFLKGSVTGSEEDLSYHNALEEQRAAQQALDRAQTRELVNRPPNSASQTGPTMGPAPARNRGYGPSAPCGGWICGQH